MRGHNLAEHFVMLRHARFGEGRNELESSERRRPADSLWAPIYDGSVGHLQVRLLRTKAGQGAAQRFF